MKMKHRYSLLVLIICLIAVIPTSGQEQTKPNTTLESLIDTVLKNAPPEVADQFRKELESATKLLLVEDDVYEKFREIPQIRQYAVEFTKQIHLIGVREQVDMGFGWGALIYINSIPREIVTEGIAKALYEFKTEEIFVISDDDNKLARYAYGQEGPDDPVSEDGLSPMLDLMRKATAEQRVKLITHLIAYSPTDTFRPLLAQERKTLKQVAELSWLDRRINELIWANENGFKLEPTFKEDIVTDLQLAVEHDTWWVRLYAVEVMLEHAQLRNPDYIKQLEKDADPVVRRRVQYLVDEMD